MINLNWIRCQGNNWCSLARINLNHEHFNELKGVYIIWHGGNSSTPPATIRVGQGNIRNRLEAHKADTQINRYQTNFTLYVTWAQVQENYMDGIESYLADVLRPLVGERFPDVTSIPVSLPW